LRIFPRSLLFVSEIEKDCLPARPYLYPAYTHRRCVLNSVLCTPTVLLKLPVKNGHLPGRKDG